mmetsp:Transcript_270/g.498  ORF Transcript_270/g.498 Transcript_270/m.498 type:complete len:370 (+) Transcript_270:27-1136(+)
MFGMLRNFAVNTLRRRPILSTITLGVVGIYTHFQTIIKPSYKENLYKMEQEILKSSINHEKVVFEQKMIEIKSGKKMNTAIFGKKGDSNLFREPKKDERILVMIHGWGSGFPLFCKNINSLMSDYDRIITFDLHGFGLSERTYFRGGPKEATAYFLNPIRELLQSLQLENTNIHMMGHSLGGYIACEYGYAFPEHLEKLTLVAPVGFDTDMFSKALQNPSPFLRLMSFLVFDCGMTMQHVLRFFGPFSERVFMNIGVSANYRNLNETYWRYLFYNQVMPSGGDRAFMAFLSREGWNPGLLERIHHLQKVKNVQFIYGERDYIRPAFAQQFIVPKLASHPSMSFNIVSNAGHHMYYENELMFNDFIRQSF